MVELCVEDMVIARGICMLFVTDSGTYSVLDDLLHSCIFNRGRSRRGRAWCIFCFAGGVLVALASGPVDCQVVRALSMSSNDRTGDSGVSHGCSRSSLVARLVY